MSDRDTLRAPKAGLSMGLRRLKDESAAFFDFSDRIRYSKSLSLVKLGLNILYGSCLKQQNTGFALSVVLYLLFG